MTPPAASSSEPHDKSAMTEQPSPRPQAYADAVRGTRHVFVRGLEVQSVVGVHAHEKRAAQRLVVGVDMTVRENRGGHHDRLDKVLDYGETVRRIQAICRNGHVNLIETLAERIAESCLEDRRVLAVRVRIEKPDAVPECTAVGIEIERLQPLS